EADAAEIGIRLYKVAMTWPLEPEGVRHFAEGLEEILVVEEKRQIVEYQVKEQLYNWRDDVRPRVVGKFDEKGEWVRPHGDWLLPATSELTPAMVARVIAQRIERLGLTPSAADEKHIFANLGDGTYYHSGILAIRAAVAAGVNITYKILYNDAVAMTGGQPFDGPLSPQDIARQVAAEGVSKIVVVSDDPDKYPG